MSTNDILPSLHPLDESGTPLDATFRLERTANGLVILYASRGGAKGSPSARNIHYHIGLTVLLGRLKGLEAVIIAIALDSQSARRQPMPERALDFPPDIRFPLDLAGIDDLDSFRRKISDAQRNVLAAPGRNAKHGNRMRSIRILFHLRQPHMSMALDSVAQVLVGDNVALPTSDPIVLEQKVSRLKSKGPVPRPEENQIPVGQEAVSVIRYIRSPVVAAYVLQRASGFCELCGRGSFLTDAGAVFLEVHHVVQLSEGGPDTPCNTAALCPNCHRELHFGVGRTRLIRSLYERVPELRPVGPQHEPEVPER